MQWSDTGVDSANKFLQKIWNLNYSISTRKDVKPDSNVEKENIYQINSFVNKIDESINNFRFNVSIGLLLSSL